MNAGETCDVAIVGLGPVGGTLANILGGYGIRTVVIERQPAAYHLPRAVTFDDEVMRIFQSVGLAGAMQEITAVGEGVDFVDGADNVLVAWPRPKVLSPNGWYVNYRFHQPALEKVLQDGMARYPGVSVWTDCEVTGLEQDADGVTLGCTESGGGRRRALRAKFVVGCDGANSFTRDAIGAGIDDLGFREPWAVVDLLLRDDGQHLPPSSVHYCDPERAATHVFLGHGRRRWEFRLRPDDDPERIVEPDSVWRLLERWIGPDEATLERATVYTFRSCVAEVWQRGRVAIAGDAAHLMPPFMGQGMCAGIRDAHNLGWKLARVVRGQAPPRLLDTYQPEREAHVRAFIELTVQMGRLINTTASALAAGNVADAAGGRQKVSMLRPSLGPGLAAGLSEWTGRLFPQPRLSTGERLDDRIGNRAALVLKPGTGSRLPAGVTGDAAANDTAIVDDDSSGLQEWFDANKPVAVALRPDRYILGTAAEMDEVSDLLGDGTDAPG